MTLVQGRGVIWFVPSHHDPANMLKLGNNFYSCSLCLSIRMPQTARLTLLRRESRPCRRSHPSASLSPTIAFWDISTTSTGTLTVTTWNRRVCINNLFVQHLLKLFVITMYCFLLHFESLLAVHYLDTRGSILFSQTFFFFFKVCSCKLLFFSVHFWVN